MSAKTLNQIDLRIEALRDLTSRDQGNSQALNEMRQLLEQRSALIEEMVAERTRQSPPPPETAS